MDSFVVDSTNGSSATSPVDSSTVDSNPAPAEREAPPALSSLVFPNKVTARPGPSSQEPQARPALSSGEASGASEAARTLQATSQYSRDIPSSSTGAPSYVDPHFASRGGTSAPPLPPSAFLGAHIGATGASLVSGLPAQALAALARGLSPMMALAFAQQQQQQQQQQQYQPQPSQHSFQPPPQQQQHGGL
eukprot:RCo004868